MALIATSGQEANSLTANQIVDLARIVLDENKPWPERQRASEKLGGLASRLRVKGQLDILLKQLSVVEGFAERLLQIATDRDQPELLRRAAAWTSSQINDWPRRFNSKVLEDKRIAESAAIDASLTFQAHLVCLYYPNVMGLGMPVCYDSWGLCDTPAYFTVNQATPPFSVTLTVTPLSGQAPFTISQWTSSHTGGGNLRGSQKLGVGNSSITYVITQVTYIHK